MSECKMFDVFVDRPGQDPEDMRGKLQVSWDFGHDRARQEAALFTMSHASMNAQMHITKESLLAFAMKVIKELAP